MFGEIRPSFEVVKEGRILNFVSGERRFLVRERITQGVAGLILAYLHSISESYNIKNCNSFFMRQVYARFWRNSGVLIGKFIVLLKKLMR